MHYKKHNLKMHKAEDLCKIFERCFQAEFNTILEAGGEEPLYRPATATQLQHKIIFTQDYFASALHEVAHWCVAGAERRLQTDYGYWYAPDGRSAQQQQAFEQVEVKPQAMEWLFSLACAAPFRVSADNLQLGLGASMEFRQAIAAQAQYYATKGLPHRAQRFFEALAKFYQQPSLIPVEQLGCPQ